MAAPNGSEEEPVEDGDPGLEEDDDEEQNFDTGEDLAAGAGEVAYGYLELKDALDSDTTVKVAAARVATQEDLASTLCQRAAWTRPTLCWSCQRSTRT